jgi:glucose-1-phosphate cytidylyltransferase
MKIYGAYGIKDFIICTGYKGFMIKEYFMNYRLHTQNIEIDLAGGTMRTLNNVETHNDDWKISIIDTGELTMTGGRLTRVKSLLQNESYFAVTYGDGVSNIDMNEVIAFHQQHGDIATITGVTPPSRFGALVVKNDKVEKFSEKPISDGSISTVAFLFFLQKYLIIWVEMIAY